jgi:acetyl-CoA carboxylase carboxyl transferase subunit beta
MPTDPTEATPAHPVEESWDVDVRGGDPLRFPGYEPPEAESVLTGRTRNYAFVVGRFDVLGGSMGAAAGERIVRAYARAADAGLPFVAFTASGGARMQEGMVALIQMARTSRAAAAHGAKGLLSLAVHRSPTTGGAFASYGSLCDLRAAVDGATIGFAGPRVVEQLTGSPLPPDAHTAASAYANAIVDELVTPDTEAAWIEGALGLRDTPLLANRPLAVVEDAGGSQAPPETPEGGDAWAEVVRARAPGRPSGVQWAATLSSSWTELRGRDPVIRAGLATVGGTRVVVVAFDRYAGAGRPTPAGFRLAQRAIALAAKLRLPLLTLVDTPGAEPGPASEADGIAREIANTFSAMAELPTPSVAICVGEGGSGGALAVAAADRLLIQEHAIFSVIAPEGAAAILHRDAGQAAAVAGQLRLTSADLLDLGIVDEVVSETPEAMARSVAAALNGARPGDRARRFDAATERWLQ